MLTAEHNGVVTTLTGDGRHLEWALPDAATALSGTESPTTDRLREAAERLASVGLAVTVTDRGKRILQIGEVSSLLGRIALGTKRIRPMAPIRLLRLKRRL